MSTMKNVAKIEIFLHDPETPILMHCGGGAIIIGRVAIVDGSVHWNHCFPPTPFKHCQLIAVQAWSILNRLWKLHFLRVFLSFDVLLFQLLLVV